MQGVDELEVRPFSSREEYELMLDYFYKADDRFLRGMGVDRLNAAIARAEAMGVEVIMPRHRNPPDGAGGPNHWEFWLRDLDGYKVVLASPDGTADGDWQP